MKEKEFKVGDTVWVEIYRYPHIFCDTDTDLGPFATPVKMAIEGEIESLHEGNAIVSFMVKEDNVVHKYSYRIDALRQFRNSKAIRDYRESKPLSAHQPKYRINQQVFFMRSNEVASGQIYLIRNTTEAIDNKVVHTCNYGVMGGESSTTYREVDIFPTREALIASL